MSTTSPESVALLDRAAALRAAGKSWAEAATQLSVGHDELRRLAAEHQRDYDRLVRRARNEVLREAVDEAVATLRRLLHSEDPDIGRSSAMTLTRYTLARMRQGLNVGGGREKKPRKITVEAENVRAENVPESTEALNPQAVALAKKPAQQPTRAAANRPASPPAPATPPAPPPAPTKPRDPTPRGGPALGRGETSPEAAPRCGRAWTPRAAHDDHEECAADA